MLFEYIFIHTLGVIGIGCFITFIYGVIKCWDEGPSCNGSKIHKSYEYKYDNRDTDWYD